MKLKLLGGFLAAVASLGVQAATVSPVSLVVTGESNLFFYGVDTHEFALSPVSKRDGGGPVSSISWVTDYMDGKAAAPVFLEVIGGATLDLTTTGIITKTMTIGTSTIVRDLNPDGKDPAFPLGDQTVPEWEGVGLYSLIGSWASEIAADNSFKPVLGDDDWDFNVGTSFSSIVPDAANYLFLGFADDSADFVTGTWNVSGTLTTPVPVPAAFWFLLSALLASFGLKRKLQRSES